MQLPCIRSKAAEPVKVLAATLINPHQDEREKVRKVISVAALLLALTCPAYAGDMPNGSPAPPSQPTNAVQEQTIDGDISTMSAGSMTQIALDLLAVLPSLY
jgi:hypothetical protein